MWCVGTGRRDPRCGAVAHHAVAFDLDEGIQTFGDARDRCSWRLGAHARHGSNAHDFSGRKPALKVERLTAGAARRLALAAQGFAQPRPGRPPDAGHVRRTIERLGPAPDRLGQRPRPLALPAALLAARPLPARAARPAGLCAAAVARCSSTGVTKPRCCRWPSSRCCAGAWSGPPPARTSGAACPVCARAAGLRRGCPREVAARGPISAARAHRRRTRPGRWWGWSDGKAALEYLFWAGQVTTARPPRLRAASTTCPSGCFPRRARRLPTPGAEDAQRELLRVAARALGVATERDLRDYYRLDVADARRASPSWSRRASSCRSRSQGWGKPA